MFIGIESSCDDTSIAILDGTRVIKNEIIRQEQHAEFGGVVPEVASRNHIMNLQNIVNKLILNSNLDWSQITAVCATVGPGLLGSLMVGAMFGKGLAESLKVPFIGVNHLEGHLLSPKIECPNCTFPFLSLLVSGGHCQIILAKSLGDYQVLGKTLDDAAGETFDKVGRLLGLKYPAGSKIDTLAQQGNATAFDLPLPMMNAKNMNMSFSGLKTAALQLVKKLGNQATQDKVMKDICASLQSAIARVLRKKMEMAIIHAIHELNINLQCIAICGGVASNTQVRQSIDSIAHKYKLPCYKPSPKYCTDNAAMIAIVGYEHYNQSITNGVTINNQNIAIQSNLPM